MRHYLCHCGAQLAAGDEQGLAQHRKIHDRDVHHLEVEVEELEEKVEHIESIIDRLRKRTATLTLSNSKGESIMDGIVHINDAPGLAVYQEFDAQGKKVPPTGAVAYASDTPAVATVDPVTGQLAYLTAGTAIITASDAGSFAASATLTVINSVAATATLTLPNTAAPVQ